MNNRWRGAAIVAGLLLGAPAYGQGAGSQMGTGGQRSPGDASSTRSTTSNQGTGMSGSEQGSARDQGSTSSTQGTGSAGSGTAAGGERSGSQTALKGDLEEKIQELHAANQAEVQLGQLGMQTAQSPEVKQYAQKLVQDHQKNDEKLQQIAQTIGVNLEGEKFQDKQKKAQEHLSDLREKQGSKFDKEFMSLMVKDHEKDVKEVEKAAKEARKQNHTELASFFETTHTGLQGHLQEAERIEKSLDRAEGQARTGSPAGEQGTGSGAAGATGPASGGTSGTTGAPSGSSPQTGGTGSSSDRPSEPSKPGAGGSGGGTGGRAPVGGGGGGGNPQ